MRTFLRYQIAVVIAVGGAVVWWMHSGKDVDPVTTESSIENAASRMPGELTQQIKLNPNPGAAIPDSEDVLQRVRGSYISDGKSTRASELSVSLNHHINDTQNLLNQLESAGDKKAALLTQLLESKQAEFVTLREEMQRLLEERGLKNSPFNQQISQRFDQVESVIAGVITAQSLEERQKKIDPAKRILLKLQPPRIGESGEPTPTFSLDKPTTLTPDDIPNAPPPAYASPLVDLPATGQFLPEGLQDGVLQAFGIADAYAGAPLAMPPEASSCNFNAADLGDALPEIMVNHPEISALAEKLEYSPIKIYSYIKNNIEFEPYYGSLKGAVGTLKSGAGGATDQASLLIALFRASNIPARFVKGEIYFDGNDSRYPDWLGVKTFLAAIKRLRQGQTPGVPVADDPDSVYNNTFVHVWAEACVPYDNYRGSNSDNSGFHWIPLDPGFKEITFTEGATVADVSGGFSFDYSGYLSTRTTVMPHEALRDQLEAVLGKPLVHNGGYRGTIIQQAIDILPSTLPYRVASFKQWDGTAQSDVAAIPQAHRIRAEFEIKNSIGCQPDDLVCGTPLIPMLSMDMVELVSGRMTLSFKGATTADQTFIDSWIQSGGEMDCTANVSVQPVFKFDGTDITPSGTPTTVDICSKTNQLRIAVKQNGVTLNEVNYTNIGGHNYHALQAYGFHASELLIEERSKRLLVDVGNTLPNEQQDDTLGEYLHIVGLKYMGYYAESSKQIGKLFGETGDSGHHIGLTSTAMRVDYFFDLAFAVSGDGMLVDVPGGKSRSLNISTGTSSFDTFLLGGYAASAYEAYIWQEHAYADAVSTVRGLQYANDVGTAIVELTRAAQVDTLLNQGCSTSPHNLNYSQSTKDTLKELFTNNYSKVTLPTCLINYDSWLGAVWASEYNVGGDYKAGYKIAGDYNGGYLLPTPISNNYDNILGTGYQSLIPTSYSNDLYSSGTTTTPQIYASGTPGTTTGVTNNTNASGDPVNMVSGNMYHQERDIYLKGRGGLDIAFERTYNSHVRKDSPLGFGWTHSFNHYLKFYDDDPSDSTTNPTQSAIWVDGTGATTAFDVTGTVNGVPVSTVFTNPDNVYVAAKREGNGEYSIREKNGLTFYFQNIAGAAGDIAKLSRVVDRNGNTLTFAYNGDNLTSVQDDLNRSLTFYYDNADHHITRVEDWSGRTFRYSYVNNNLDKFETPQAVAGQEQSTTAYVYYTASEGTNLDRAMKSFTYPNGNSMTFEYYTNGKVFRHKDSQGQTFTFRYNKFRRETVTTDERGTSQTYLFNEYGQQVQHIQGDESRLQYEYTDINNPLSETKRQHTLGYETQSKYDFSGDLTKSTLPDGSTLEYLGRGDNAFHLPCTIKGANGNYVLYRYDNKGNRTDVIALKKNTVLTAPERNSCSYTPSDTNILSWSTNAYDAHGNLLKSKQVKDFSDRESQGPYVEYTYDGTNFLNPETIKRCGLQQNASGTLMDQCVTATQTFDALGRIKQGVNGAFYESQVEYNANGRISRATDSLGQWQDFSYDDNGNLEISSLLGVKSDGKMGLLVHNTVTYDTLDRPISQTNVAGHAAHSEYDEIGNVIKVTNPDGFSIHFEYDKQNRPTKAYDEHGHAVSTEYDIGGRPTKVTNPNGISTTYQYYGASENGRLQKVITADNRTLEYFYDDNGNVTKTSDNAGRESLTEYDALNRPVRSVGPTHDSFIDLSQMNARLVTKTTYNSLGYVTTLQAGYTTDPLGAATGDVLAVQATYIYDDFGHLIEKHDANSKIARYFYDSHGNQIRTESPNGHIVELAYDHARSGLLTHRTAKRSAGDGSPHITTYHYNTLGQITSVVTPEVTYSYTHDSANRLATVTDSRGNKTLTYDRSPGGLLNSITDSENKRTDFLYDAAGRLTAMQAPYGERVNFVFDAGGRLRETNSPNGVSARYSYDDGNKLTKLVNQTSQGIISQHDYGYDTSGRRSGHTENIAATTTDYTYSYDNLDRLVEVFKDAGATSVENYKYDQYGNRRTRHPNGGPTHFYQYDNAQQLQNIRDGSDVGSPVASFTYDDNGNLISKDESGVTRAFTYDALDQLEQVEGSNIATETYKYDPKGRRIEKDVAGTKQRFLYSGMSIWSEYGSDWNAALAHYSYTGIDQPVVRGTPNANDTRYYHQDGLGSAVAVSDNGGVTQGSARFDAWGNTLAGSGVPQFGYTGREPDATGLIYYRARYYDPTAGRFTQRDPIGFGDGINPYAYAGSSPTNFTDPLGLTRQAITAGSGVSSSFAGASNDSGFWSTVQSGVSNLVDEVEYHAAMIPRFIEDEGINVVMDTLTVYGGAAQIGLGGTLCATAAGCAIGGPLAALGVSNVYEGFSGKDGPARNVAIDLMGDEDAGNFLYGGVNLATSIGGLARPVLKASARPLFNTIPKDFVQAYKTSTQFGLGMEGVTSAVGIYDTHDRVAK